LQHGLHLDGILLINFPDALPGRTKQRKTSASRRDVSVSEEPETQSIRELFVLDQPVVAKHVKKSNLNSRKSELDRATRDEEYEEDPGRAESQ